MAAEFQVAGANANALFALKVHRGDGMALLAMNWKQDAPPDDFVGFAIEYREPDGDRFYPLKNRLAFPTAGGALNPNQLSTLQSPIQKFRWVHFPAQRRPARRVHLPGDAGVHGRRRRAQLRRGADGRDRAPPRDLSRCAERRVHAWLRRRRRRSWTATSRQGRSRRCCPRTPTPAWTSSRRIRRRRRRSPGWASRRGSAILDVLDHGDRGSRREGLRDRVRPERARDRVAAEEARHAAEGDHRRQRRPRRAGIGRDKGGGRSSPSPPARKTSSASTCSTCSTTR